MNFNMIYGYPLLSECCSIIHSSDQYFYFSLADVENRAQPIRLNLLKPAGIDGDSGDLSPLSWGFSPTYGDFSPLMGIFSHFCMENFPTFGNLSPLTSGRFYEDPLIIFLSGWEPRTQGVGVNYGYHILSLVPI